MGVHVSLVNAEGEEHPTWDWTRYVGDRDIFPILNALPCRIHIIEEDTVYRPCNPVDLFIGLRDKLGDVNVNRWQELRMILESEPEYWLSFSW